MNEYVNSSVGQSLTQNRVSVPVWIMRGKYFLAIDSCYCFLKGYILYISEWGEDGNPY